MLTVAQASTALQQSFDQWNDIPTSFIDMKIVGTVPNAGLVGFDMVNELSFRTAAAFGAIASSPSTALIADSTFANGDDIDGDGDSDVSSAITVATDVDADGDMEFPAGFYKAGTILDNDVQFNTKTTNGFRFTVGDAAIDTVEPLGGLQHRRDPRVRALARPVALAPQPEERHQRRRRDDVSVHRYRGSGLGAGSSARSRPTTSRGARSSIPKARRSPDPPQSRRGTSRSSGCYGVIEGNVQHGVLDQPIAGANAFAVSKLTGRVVSSGFSGTTQLRTTRLNGGLFVINPAFNILDGKYRIPVPLGIYGVGIEPIDGQPVPAASVSLTTQLGSFFGQLNFNEEFYNRNREEAIEVRPW